MWFFLLIIYILIFVVFIVYQRIRYESEKTSYLLLLFFRTKSCVFLTTVRKGY